MNIQSIIDRAYSPQNTHAIGTITPEEARFACEIIRQVKPTTAVELGVASGRSSVVMSLCLAGMQRGHLHSFDYADRYYGDETLPVGFLLEEVLNESELEFSTIHTKCTALDVGKKFQDKSLDLVFIDANHQHPWPTLDTVAILPLLTENAVVLHHDLRLFATPQQGHGGVGPKYLFDCTAKDRILLPVGYNPMQRVLFNMFGVRYPGSYKQYADELADSLLMPHSIGQKIDSTVKNDFEFLINKYYSGTSLPDAWDAVKNKL